MTDSKLDFSGRTALVTGAASGIGAALARWLDAHGVGTLHLVDVNGEALEALDLDCQVVNHVADVANPDFWAGFEKSAGKLDHAAVNAGIGTGGAMAEVGFDTWRKVMSVNLDGAFLTLAAALRLMRANGRGSAVVTSSVTALKPVPGIGPYGVAKAAVAHMARIAAAENAAHGIRVNAIAPGGVDTNIWEASENFRAASAQHGREAAIAAMGASHPRGHFATPEELANDIGYLLSDMSANVTGTVLVSDGGYTF
jgi:NAD(P)-dependent dehydrogenase (short-subunit alcohol dehydrogenase family)